MHLEVDGNKASTEAVSEAIDALLADNTLISMATLDSEGLPYCNTAYFARHVETFDLVIFTEPTKNHSINIERNSAYSATIFDSRQTSSPLRGIQIFGTARRLAGQNARTAYETYAKRFSWLAESAPNYDAVETEFNSRFYELRVSRIRLFDEARFGVEELIDARIS